MLDIKFRGQRIDNGEWVYGDLVHEQFDGSSHLVEVGIQQPHCYPSEVTPETVGQFTGLKDNTKWEQLTEEEKKKFWNNNKSEDGKSIKYDSIEKVKHLWNGKEIYEGDIVKVICAYDMANMIVSYENCMFVLKTIDCLGYKQLGCMNNLEIIGNIHEHPHLLGGNS